MLKIMFRLILFSVAVLMSLLSLAVSAKDYNLFSLDYDYEQWVEVVKETPDEIGANNVILVNIDSQAMLSIMTQELGTTLSNEEIEARCRIIVDYYRQNGLTVKESSFDQNTGMFMCKGEYDSMPFEMHLYVNKTILVVVSAHGANTQPSFELARQMKFK